VVARQKRTTKEKLMDAAEKLFARRGFHGSSLRDITGAAGVDLALVNYHAARY
jgi:AcrR family transcriptional regulator